MAVVSISQDRDITKAITAALAGLDMEGAVRGRLVAVKPNETWASRDDTTAVTQPDTLRAVIRHLKGLGPRHLVVTGGAGAGETDEIFRIAGLMAVVEGEGVEFFDHNRPPFTEVPLPCAPDREVVGPQRSVMVNPRVLDYETVVAVNQLKHHEAATVTLGLKNIAMSFPAADYYGHPRSAGDHDSAFFDDVHSFIAAMAKRFPARFSLTVGHPAMVGAGPIGGHTVETGMAVASDDFLLCDVVCARLLGFDIQAVRHLWEAARLGVGRSDPSRAHFPGLSLEEAVRRHTEAVYGRPLSFEHA